MSVTFFPDNPIDALENIITKENGEPLYGEVNIYRRLWEDLSNSELEWFVWHDLKLPDHSDNYNYYKKTSAQIDFVILCKHGVIVLEIKGGPISTKDNIFYYGKSFETKMKQNPFKQVEGYKFTLKDKILNNFRNCFFCEVVAFPHVDYPFESKLIDDNLLWTAYKSREFNNSFEEFLLHAISYLKNKHRRHFREYNSLSIKEVNAIKSILSPKLGDRNHRQSINTKEWLKVQNLEILDGLIKNQRILIEGPPGSGKTTIAKAYIDKQHNKKGIYLCWNNLLMHYTKSILTKRNLTNNIEVSTYFSFFQKLNPHISYSKLISFDEDDFYNLVKETIDRLDNNNQLIAYDYIVIDEAQDLFDRGLDLFINRFSGFSGKGLTNGNSLILYDIDQSYYESGRSVAEIADLMTEFYSHYKINEVKRSAQNPEIRALASEILDNPEVILNEKAFPKIMVNIHNSLKDVKTHIVRNILTPIRERDSSLLGKDCVLLIESTFLKGSYNGHEDLRELLIIKDIEELNSKNIGDTSNLLRFTSILRYKGLEKKNVYLVVSEPNDLNKYEIFVGATRAMLNLEINVVK